MSWLERNQRLLKEIADQHTFTMGPIQRGGHFSDFQTAGSYNSTELGEQLHVGLKVSAVGAPERSVRDRAISEITIFHIIATEDPSLIPMLPRFHGILRASSGAPHAVITEDFSQGATKKVDPYRIAPSSLLDILDHPFRIHLSPEQIAVKTGEEIRLVDFYPAVFMEEKDDHLRREIAKKIEDYTIQI